MSEIITHAHHVAEIYETRDPFRVCRYEGIRVNECPLLEMRGLYTRIRGFGFIFLADDLLGHERYFVCAHELGHHFRHQGLNRAFMDSRTFMETNRYEDAADKFALHFLFGGPSAQQDYALTYIEMAECLNTPTALVNARLMELGMFQ